MKLQVRILVAVLVLALPTGTARVAGSNVRVVEAPASRAETVGVPWVGQAGVTRSVASIMEAAKRSGPITKGVVVDVEEREREQPDRSQLPQNPDSPYVASWPPSTDSSAASAQLAPDFQPFTVGLSFEGANLHDSGLIPPDSMGAVGPTQIVVIVNGRIRVFNKDGSRGALDATTNEFFDTVRDGHYTSDPRVRFDRLTNRWFFVMITVSLPNRVAIAVSDGPEITDATSLTFFQFQQDQVGPTPNSDTGALADYATLGVDNNALYIGANMFTTQTYVGSSVFVVRKSSILGQGPIVVTAFRNLADGNRQGIDTPQGVSNDDPAATEGYFIGVDTQRFGILNVRRVSDPGGTPALSGDIGVTIPATSLPLPIRPLGSDRSVDTSNDRLFAAQIHLNRFTGRRTLWTAHAIQVDSTGVASTSGGRTASRWYEVGDLATTPRLLQAGTLFDTTPGSSPRSYFFPSIAMNGQGHAVIGATSAGPQDRAGVSVASRLGTDALGQLREPARVLASDTNYNVQTDETQRWGDYSYTCVDPEDGMRIWTFQEYCEGRDSWGVRVVELRPPGPAALATGSPVTVPVGRTTSVTLAGVASNGTGFFDNDATYSKRLRATVSGAGVTVAAVSVPDPSHVVLTLTVSADAAAGPRGVTIVNPDGQSTFSPDAITIGAALDSATLRRLPSGKFELVLSGAGFSAPATVFVDGVACASPPRSTSATEIVQRGKLANGRALNRAIRRGQTVTITVQTGGGSVSLSYTRT